jgi:hypothetical protein
MLGQNQSAQERESMLGDKDFKLPKIDEILEPTNERANESS